MPEFVVIMTMIINPLCALMLLKILLTSSFENAQTELLIRLAIVSAIAGLIGQSMQSYETFVYGFSDDEQTTYWWVGKDFAIILVTIYTYFETSDSIKSTDFKTNSQS